MRLHGWCKIFDHLKTTLQRPCLEQRLVITICLNIKACENRVQELDSISAVFGKNGSPATTLEKLKLELKSKSRRAIYPFRASTISRISEVIEDIKEDIYTAVSILSLLVYFHVHAVGRELVKAV
jgi:hypothetical protein